MMNNKKRIAWIDAAKGIGIILIVLGHTLQGHQGLRQFTYAFSVPFFFILVGCSYRFKEDRLEFYISKAKKILIPYYTFSVISIVLFKFLGKLASSVSSAYATTEIIPNIMGMLYGNNRTGYMKWNSPLWFLTCLFVTYVLVENYEYWIIKRTKHTKTIRMLGIVVSFGISYILITEFENLKLPFQFESAIMMFGYVQIGVVVKNFVIDKDGLVHKKTIYRCFVIILLVIAGTAISVYNGFTDAATYIFGKSVLLYIFSSCILSFAMLFLSIVVQNNKTLQYLGKHTLPILLMHKFPVLFFQVLVPFTKNLLVTNRGGYLETL